MALFALLCALLIEQIRPLATHNPIYRRYRQYTDWVVHTLEAGQHWQHWLIWGVAIAAPTATVAAIHHLLIHTAWPLAWLWAAAVLYTTLGFRQFSGHITAICTALNMGNTLQARQLLAQWKQIDTLNLPRVDMMREMLAHGVLDAHHHVFGVIAAYVLGLLIGLGPAGAVLYRCAEYICRYWSEQDKHTSGSPPSAPLTDSAQAHRRHIAQQAWNILNWLPARTTALVFAIAGNLVQAIDNWRIQTAPTHPPRQKGEDYALDALTPSEHPADTPLTPPPSTSQTYIEDLTNMLHHYASTGWAGILRSSSPVVLASAFGAIDLDWQPLTPHPNNATTNPNQDPSPHHTGNAYHDHFADTTNNAPTPPLRMTHLQQLTGLVWRAVIFWTGAIALVTITQWVNG